MFKFLVYTFVSIVLSACSGGASDGQVSTLYRNSVTNEKMRIHVASFDASYDASEREEYNRGNCEQTQLLFKNQPGMKTRYWCEKGRFKQ